MKTLVIAGTVLTVVMLLSTAICGLWIQGQGKLVDPSSIQFHMVIGLVAVFVGIVTVIGAAVVVMQSAA